MKTFSTIVICVLSFTLYSQNLSLSQTDYSLEFGEYMDYQTISLINNGSSTIEIAGTVDPICYDSSDDTEITVCLGEKCYFPTSTTKTWGTSGTAPITLGPGESTGAIKLTPSVSSNNLGTVWNLHLFDRNDTTNIVTITLNVDQCTTSNKNETIQTLGNAYPNPAAGFVKIPLLANNKSESIHIFNSLGKLIEEVDVTSYVSEYKLMTTTYVEGQYYYNIIDKEGRKSKVLSFTKM